MVTAAGDAIQANETHNADILWASCGGGGGQFGVVTSMSLKTIPTSLVTRIYVKWNKTKLTGVMNWFQDQSKGAPDNLFLDVSMNLAKDVRLTGHFAGEREQLEEYLILSNMSAIGNETSREMETVSFIESILLGAGLNKSDPTALLLPGEQLFWKHKSAFSNANLRQETLNEFCETFFYNHPPKFDSLYAGLQFDLLGGKVAAKSDNETAFAHRENVDFSLQMYLYWNPAAKGATLKLVQEWMKWQEEVHKIFMKDMRGAYINYVDEALDNYMEDYHGGNQHRLREIKKRYDPLNLFRFHQSIIG